MGTVVDYEVECTVPGALNIRKGPGLSYSSVGIMYPGWKGRVREVEGTWFRHNGWVNGDGWNGWSNSEGRDTGKLLTYLKITNSNTQVKTEPAPAKLNEGEIPILEYISDWRPNVNDYKTYDSMVSKDLFIKDIRGIHGMPYQFMPEVDQRLIGGTFGRKYAEKIVSKMPLLLLTPGAPDYLSRFDKDDKNNILQYMAGVATSANMPDIESLLSKQGRYYTFRFDYMNYYRYVNPMCQMGAQFLGIGDKKIDNTKLKNYQWEKWVNSNLKGVISQKEFVAFYIDSETQISESFSNSTGESMLSQKAKGVSDLSREVSFLLGAGAGVELEGLQMENYKENLAEFEKFADKYLNGSAMIKNIGAGFYSIATGGKLIFPEIWNDSSFSKSYDVSMKLRTPDSDPFSWYMNIYVPLMHLIAMTAPRQMVPSKGMINPNAYQAPFLVRGFYKGLFSCDMGIITGLNISKGSQAAWTPDGLPTEVDVSISIKDLYPVMAISDQTDASMLLNNTVLIDYLATSCGINVNKPEVLRMVDIYLAQKYNALTALPSYTFMGIEQALSTEWFNLIKNGI